MVSEDRDDGLPGCSTDRYLKRTWTEELFRDEKSSGIPLGAEPCDRTRVMQARLVLVMALATYLALGLGSRMIKAGLRRLMETTRQRKLSLFQVGLRFLMYCTTR